MEAEFYEFYSNLNKLQPGQIAVSKDRKSIFIVAKGTNPNGTCTGQVVINLNNVNNQYGDRVELNQPVRILEAGDKFIITI